MMRESRIENYGNNYAKSLGWLVYKFVSPGNRSVPDRIYFRNGKCVLIEYKAPGKKPTKLQSRTIEKLWDENIPVYIVDSREGVHDVFDILESA